MGVFTVTLIALAAMAGMILLTLPVIGAVRVWDAFQTAGEEVQQQELVKAIKKRASLFFFGAGVVGVVADFGPFPKYSVSQGTLMLIEYLLMALGLAINLYWAKRLLANRSQLDERLVRFFRYSFWLSGVGLMVVLLLAIETGSDWIKW